MRLIAPFTKNQLEAIPTIEMPDALPAEQGLQLKAQMEVPSGKEQVWYDPSTGEVFVHQADNDRKEFILVPELGYQTTIEDRLSLLLQVDVEGELCNPRHFMSSIADALEHWRQNVGLTSEDDEAISRRIILTMGSIQVTRHFRD